MFLFLFSIYFLRVLFVPFLVLFCFFLLVLFFLVLLLVVPVLFCSSSTSYFFLVFLVLVVLLVLIVFFVFFFLFSHSIYDLRIRSPACSEYWFVCCLETSSRPLYVEAIHEDSHVPGRARS